MLGNHHAKTLNAGSIATMAPKFRIFKRRTARSFSDTNQGKTGDKAGPRRLVRRFFYSRSVVTILFETTIAFRVQDAPPAFTRRTVLVVLTRGM
jgi:hypothetical protein